MLLVLIPTHPREVDGAQATATGRRRAGARTSAAAEGGIILNRLVTGLTIWRTKVTTTDLESQLLIESSPTTRLPLLERLARERACERESEV